MSLEGSVTKFLRRLPECDQEAINELWQRYFQRLVGLARAKLQNFPKRVVDDEDLALSAFDSLCRGAEKGRFPLLDDRNNLWILLVTITDRKVKNLKRDQQRQKRGGILGEGAHLEDGIELGQVLGREPSPDFAAEIAEQCQLLLNGLAKEDLRQLAIWKMEGYTNNEISEKLDCSLRTIERKLELIREVWEKKCDAK